MPENWKSEPDEHDFPAALDYLSLLIPGPAAAELVALLRAADLVHRKAKDILRASGLPLLDETDAHVRKDLHKAAHGTALSPVLLVRGGSHPILGTGALVIADGYHRVCASYHLGDDTDIPCRLA
ncbi:MAG TPA: hypothetical protein VGH57_00435 [Amycolatopsis sp.]|jgi:hypothetical protein